MHIINLQVMDLMNNCLQAHHKAIRHFPYRKEVPKLFKHIRNQTLNDRISQIYLA